MANDFTVLDKKQRNKLVKALKAADTAIVNAAAALGVQYFKTPDAPAPDVAKKPRGRKPKTEAASQPTPN